VSSPLDPQHAPVGDVGAALMTVAARLKTVHDGRTGADPEQQALMQRFIASLGPEAVDDVPAGTCTLICIFMTWPRKDPAWSSRRRASG
jgi:hypothetical protein